MPDKDKKQQPIKAPSKGGSGNSGSSGNHGRPGSQDKKATGKDAGKHR